MNNPAPPPPPAQQQQSTPPELINNSTIKYTPITLPSSKVTIQCSNLTQIQTLYPQIITVLDSDLTQCLSILPPSLTPFIHRTRIWLNLSYSYGLLSNPRKVIHTTAHHTLEFLQWIRDVPQKVYGIEVYSIEFYLENRKHWNGCGLILHELCHLIHQFVFGLEDDGIKRLWESMKESERYNVVLRRDWAGLEQDHDMAYALINHKEFFAEMSVTYLAKSYTELDTFVGAGNSEERNSMKECCPPITSEKVLERLQQNEHGKHDENENGFTQTNETTHDDEKRKNNCESNVMNKEMTSATTTTKTSTAISVPKGTLPEEVENEEEESSCLKIFLRPSSMPHSKSQQQSYQTITPHCNKFYPFTAGQLKHYDVQLYQSMEKLWNIVTEWKDPYLNNSPCWGWKIGMETKKDDLVTMRGDDGEGNEGDEMVVVDTVEL